MVGKHSLKYYELPVQWSQSSVLFQRSIYKKKKKELKLKDKKSTKVSDISARNVQNV